MNGMPDIDVARRVADTYLLPGELVVLAVPARVTTILGSCVSVCLFDAFSGVAGINHFLLPGTPPENDSEPLRWSAAACRQLYERVLLAGASSSRLQAKVFGGASVGMQRSGDRMRIGERNVDAATAVLAEWRLVPVASDVGGTAGRKLVFESHTGKAWVRTLVQGGG